MKTPAHHDKPLIGFLCVLIAFALFYIYYQNQNFLFDSNNLGMFVVMTAAVLALMLVLFFLVSNRIDKAHATHHAAKKSTKKKKK